MLLPGLLATNYCRPTENGRLRFLRAGHRPSQNGPSALRRAAAFFFFSIGGMLDGDLQDQCRWSIHWSLVDGLVIGEKNMFVRYIGSFEYVQKN